MRSLLKAKARGCDDIAVAGQKLEDTHSVIATAWRRTHTHTHTNTQMRAGNVKPRLLFWATTPISPHTRDSAVNYMV